jgi:hypothetical protein
LKLLRQLGYVADVVERWLPHANVRRDLFGCIDLIAVHALERGVLAVQCTTRGHVSDRLAKARGRPELRTWLAAGNRLEVWGWQRRERRWEVVRVTVTYEALADDSPIILPRRRRSRQRELFA